MDWIGKYALSATIHPMGKHGVRMMPMNRKLYPGNWDAIARDIKERAAWKCQQCCRPCRTPGEDWETFCLRLGADWYSETSEEFGDDESGEWGVIEKAGRFVLTVAHLDQNPGNNSPENLKALCSVCHLRYDAKAHATSRKRNRRMHQEQSGQLTLPPRHRGRCVTSHHTVPPRSPSHRASHRSHVTSHHITLPPV